MFSVFFLFCFIWKFNEFSNKIVFKMLEKTFKKWQIRYTCFRNSVRVVSVGVNENWQFSTRNEMNETGNETENRFAF